MGVVRVVVSVVAALVLAGPASAAVKGADVSHWNGTVDWLQFANAGYSFAFLKATEGTSIVDPTYPINRADAATFGIRTGAYHFARPAGSGDAQIVADALAQADRYVDVAGLQPGDLPPALDLETTGGLAPAALQEWTQAWLDEVTARTGVRAVVYFSPNFWKTSLGDTPVFAQQGYRLWIAHWKVAAPTVPGGNWGGFGWTFWQWTDCEPIPGFLHCADGDRFAGTSLASVAVPAFPAAAPSPVSTPTVVGTPQAGKLLAAVPGGWNGGRPIAFSYQWQSCDAAGGGCVPIPGATGETYTPSAADVGHALVVSVTAQNGSGPVGTASSPTVAVASGGTAGAQAPVATSVPSISGTAEAGQQLTASVGTWTGSPTGFALQWRRCDPAGASCTAIPGATASAYTLSPGDIGATVSLLVTATGPGGSRTAASAATAVIAEAPVPAASPGSAVAGTAAAGAVAAADGSTVTWQPGAVVPGATVSLAVGSQKLALPGTALTLGVSAPLAWPVDVRWASGDGVVGLAGPPGRWQAVPQLPTPSLGSTQQAGAYLDAGGALHVLTRVGGTFALFAPGKWGDPTRIAVGAPVMRRATPLVLRGRGSTFLVATRIVTASQSHLYISLGPLRHQALVRAPGGFPIRLAIPARALPHGKRLNLRIVAVDPYGRRAALVIPVRRG